VAATADLTVLTLARVLPHRWADQETRFGIEGRAASFDEIAQRENKVERHIRYLAPLAFVSQRIVEAIAKRQRSGRSDRLDTRPRAPT
jgi:hypothetical protein